MLSFFFILRNLRPTQGHKGFLLCFSSRSFVASCFAFRPMIHLKLTRVCDVRYGPSFPPPFLISLSFQNGVTLYHLKIPFVDKIHIFSHRIFWAPLLRISEPCHLSVVSLSSVCLCVYHTISIPSFILSLELW